MVPYAVERAARLVPALIDIKMYRSLLAEIFSHNSASLRC